MSLQEENLERMYAEAVELQNSGEFKSAALKYRQILDGNETHYQSAVNLGLCLERLKRFDDAILHYRAILPSFRNSPDIHNNLGVIYWHLQNYEPAVACFRDALAIMPDHAPANFHLGKALDRLGHHIEAEPGFRTAIDLQPQSVAFMSGLGHNLLDQGKVKEAIEYFTDALKLEPDHRDSHIGLARGYLLEGDLKRGWSELGWRRGHHTWHDPGITGVGWQGESLRDKTILLYSEQGFGDVIHLSRFAGMVSDLGASVILSCPRTLVGLMESIKGPEAVFDQGEQQPKTDFVCSLFDLPGLLGIELENLPGVIPYLRSPHMRLSRKTKSRPLRVGLVWAGNPSHERDRQRSVQLTAFSPLLSIPDVEFVSLQIGEARQELSLNGLDALILDAGERLVDFSDTAEVLTTLDLLITVDTAAAHLAGAMAMPVWTILPQSPDWRWMLGRTDTPWYPTMTLYRQSTPHDWTAVIDRIKCDLCAFVA